MQISVPTRVVDWRAATVILQAAIEKAEALGIRINVAVVDSGGQLAGFLRMPGAYLASIDIAIDKAWTSAGFGFPTMDAAAILQNMPEAVKSGLPHRPRVVLFGGGVPLTDGGVVIGGVGVSGGSDEQDHQCCVAGLAALEAAAG